MFKRSRRKIVLSIMGSLLLLFAVTLSVILLASTHQIRQENMELLLRHAELFHLESESGSPQEAPQPESPAGMPPLDKRPDYQLSTFYSVAFGEPGDVLSVDTGDRGVYGEEELTRMAEEILTSQTPAGRQGNLMYILIRKPGYTLVAFMDTTLSESGLHTLMRNVLLFGTAAMVVLFFLSLCLSGKIIRPLEESDLRQKQFISDASHELKTPVAVIETSAEMLQREIGKNDWLSSILYENERMSGLVRQLLDLSRAERTDVPMEQVDLSRIVTGEVLAFEALAFDRGKEILSRVEDGIQMTGNRTQLAEIVSILLDNALQHGTEQTIELTLARQGHAAQLTVENEGDAIPQDKMQHLFDRFYRLDEARGDEGHHYGLGLSIAKAIAERHGGEIAAACFTGKIRFTVSLPIRK